LKKALITGITGQDGSYLAELLLEKGAFFTTQVKSTTLEKSMTVQQLWIGWNKSRREV